MFKDGIINFWLIFYENHYFLAIFSKEMEKLFWLQIYTFQVHNLLLIINVSYKHQRKEFFWWYFFCEPVYITWYSCFGGHDHPRLSLNFYSFLIYSFNSLILYSRLKSRSEKITIFFNLQQIAVAWISWKLCKTWTS